MRTVRCSGRRGGVCPGVGGVCPGVGVYAMRSVCPEGCLPGGGVSTQGVYVTTHALKQTPPVL